MSKKIGRKKRKKLNVFFKVFSIISVVIAIVFCIMLFLLDMIPAKFLIIIYSVVFILYVLMLVLSLISKVKISIKFFCAVFFLAFNIIFCIGIKYIGDTISFVDIIDNVMHQKEEYYVMTLDDFNGSSINDLKNKNIGIYSNVNSGKATDKLSDKIKFNDILFSDITKMFDDLENNEIDAILINGSIKTLLETEFKDLEEKLKEIYSFAISIEKKDDIVKVVDVTRQPFNIYVAGGDAYGDIGNVTNTDVNMVVSADPVNKKLLLTSIPRDYYVNLPSFGEKAYDKLTHAGYYGIEESVSAVEKLLDIEINYYVKVNFSTIEDVIDAIGGVDVYSDYEFRADVYPHYYRFKKGYNHLSGSMALAFARERKSFIDGDVQRVKNQQKVLTSVIDKASSSTTIITNFSRILDSVSNSFSTNLDSKSISRLVKMQLNDMSSWKIESQNLTGTDYYTTETYTFPGTSLYVMKRDEEVVAKTKEEVNKFLYSK